MWGVGRDKRRGQKGNVDITTTTRHYHHYYHYYYYRWQYYN
jgi:hypothetical protein